VKILKTFTYDASQKESSAVTTLKQFSETQEQNKIPKISSYREGKSHLHITPNKGKAFNLCASHSEEYICCNMHVLDAISNCPYDCSYCFLQNYLNDGTLKVTGDIQSMVDEVKQKTALEPWRFFRIGTWELGDSLALDPLTNTSKELIEKFADLPNVILELRTKSDAIENVLDAKHKGRTILAWSVNPEEIVRKEEFRTASMKKRIDALEQAQQADYLLALHFDPTIYYDNWKQGYEELIDNIFAKISVDKITWISLGSLRFNPEMKRTIEQNFPGSKITLPEMVTGNDGKTRYIKPLRIEMYQFIYACLNKYFPKDNPPFLYFCMERWDVWEEVFGYSPDSIGHLDYLMNESLHFRFPNLTNISPELNKYI
jgi:spore photoproduct lyase